jgi:hypothetical protein
MSDIEVRNAVITSARITTADHGLLSAWLTLDYGGYGQEFGGHVLYLPKTFAHHGGPNYGGHFIFRVMEVAGVENWSDLPGKTIRVKAAFTKVEEIGHIVIEDWFNPTTDAEQMRAEWEAKR